MILGLICSLCIDFGSSGVKGRSELLGGKEYLRLTYVKMTMKVLHSFTYSATEPESWLSGVITKCNGSSSVDRLLKCGSQLYAVHESKSAKVRLISDLTCAYCFHNLRMKA